MTDESVFEVGKNIATTEGSVVYENDLMQLIKYAPLTPKVASRPLLVVPPCINKFYIMDLQPDNSLIRFMVDQWQRHRLYLGWWRGDIRHRTGTAGPVACNGGSQWHHAQHRDQQQQRRGKRQDLRPSHTGHGGHVR